MNDRFLQLAVVLLIVASSWAGVTNQRLILENQALVLGNQVRVLAALDTLQHSLAELASRINVIDEQGSRAFRDSQGRRR